MTTLQYLLRREWHNVILLLLPFFILPFIWSEMPEQIPIHWNLQGEVDRYGSKAFGLMVLPVTNLFTYIILLFLPHIDPKKRFTIDQKPLPVIRTLLVVFLLACHFWILLNVYGTYPLDPNWLLLAIAGFFVVMGNYLRTIKPNYFVGIRVPWALEDEENWRKTHRMGSVVWVTGGLLLLLAFPFTGQELFSGIFTAVAVTIAILPVIYSFYLYKKHSLH